MDKKCKLCRAEGQKLFLKGARCYSDKCSISRRQSTPGQHGSGRKKTSEYGLQLRTKQKAKRYYGILEKQFRHYYDLALKVKEGKTGENMLSLIERRLDNVVYRLGWASSRIQARQFTTHGNICVNGKRVNIPSFSVKEGSKITISERGKKNELFKNLIAEYSKRNHPKWIEFDDKEHYSAKILAMPHREDIDLDIDETLIVELYSK